jgi:UDP-glucuronate 4-epimerase
MRIAERLLTEGHHVVGLDAVTPHYDPSLKRARLARLARFPAFINHETPLENAGALTRQVAKADAEIVVHLAAQPGVRDSHGH